MIPIHGRLRGGSGERPAISTSLRGVSGSRFRESLLLTHTPRLAGGDPDEDVELANHAPTRPSRLTIQRPYSAIESPGRAGTGTSICIGRSGLSTGGEMVLRIGPRGNRCRPAPHRVPKFLDRSQGRWYVWASTARGCVPHRPSRPPRRTHTLSPRPDQRERHEQCSWCAAPITRGRLFGGVVTGTMTGYGADRSNDRPSL